MGTPLQALKPPGTLTTTLRVPLTSNRVLHILRSPATMFNLKPSIKDYSPAAGRSSESPVTYEMRINYFWEFSTLTTVCFQRTETGSIFSVDAWPVKTRSTWIVQNSGPGECNLMEDFEILSAPWGMWWFVLWVAGKQHRDLVEMVARKAMDADLGGAEGPEL